jgi:thiamine pyrophosphate-dependent acetolactate synthase large subunit-like protein
MSAPTSVEVDEAFVATDSGTGVEVESASVDLTVAEALATALRDLGVTDAYGVCGGAQALLWAAFSKHLDLLHFRHESGAAFAATEAHFASGRPVVVFTTTGPGITNALTGMLAARSEGAKVVLVSAYASAPRRGRGGIQETSGYTMPTSALFEPGPWFDDAVILETSEQLPQVLRRLQSGLARAGGYVAHITVPNSVQGATVAHTLPSFATHYPGNGALPPATNRQAIRHAVALLSEAPFAIWVGFGARGAAAELRELVDRTGAPVMCSPRAKGVFPETHPSFIGVTGMGGHGSYAAAYMRDHAPRRVLVLGTRLGEPTSFWNAVMVPDGGFVHVDIDPMVPGVAYPDAETYPVQAEVGEFLRALLEAWPQQKPVAALSLPKPHPAFPPAGSDGARERVRPDALMAAVQRYVVDGSNAIVLAESGNAFTWATHYLRFAIPGRYRVSTNLGSMGHAATGVIGAALGANGTAVAIVGDGAMLMNSSEVNTAVKRCIPAVWIVLNDGRYNMCHQGMAALKMDGMADAFFPPVDFAQLAQSMGATGVLVDHEDDLDNALRLAMAATGPTVIDVMIDADLLAPTQGRNEGLRPTRLLTRNEGMSFPVLSAD